MTACAVVMAWVGYMAGYRTGSAEAEARCPVHPEDFAEERLDFGAGANDHMNCVRDGSRVRCDKGLNP